jgi:hypothetical protein
MRILAVAVSLLALSACAVGNDPLSATGSEDQPGAAAATPQHLTLRLQRPSLQLRASTSTTTTTPPTDAPTFRQQAIADVAASVSYAAQQSLTLATAGQNRDVVGVENAAVELANAAGLAAQRAQEMQAASVDSGDCGCEGCPAADPSDPSSGITQTDVDNAVLAAQIASEVGGNIDGDLNPPDGQSCSQECGCEGCSQVCQDVPGTVDQTTLDGDIQSALDASSSCDDASGVLTNQPE